MGREGKGREGCNNADNYINNDNNDDSINNDILILITQITISTLCLFNFISDAEKVAAQKTVAIKIELLQKYIEYKKRIGDM